MIKHNYSVKAVNFSMGHDGDCMNCNLYNDNKKIASVWDDSYGGEYQIDWIDKKEEKIFYDFLPTLGKVPNYDFNYSKECFIGKLVNKVVREKENKKMVKLFQIAIVIRFKGNNDYTYVKLPLGSKFTDYEPDEIIDWAESIINDLKENEYIANDNLPYLKLEKAV